MSDISRTRRRILIVDDHELVRDGVRLRVESDPNYAVCGEADDTADALELVRRERPDLAVVDISLKTGHGLDLVKRMRALTADLRIVVCSMHDVNVYAERALRAGAHGYVRKDRSSTDLLDAIRTVLDGRMFAPAEVLERMQVRSSPRQKREAAAGGSAVDLLTNRELEVVERIGRGHSISQIASELQVSSKTIETYRDRIRAKLNIDSAHELQHFAFRWVSDHNE